jgi:toxin-antitoxin system PIN domain toxin
MSFAIDVNVLLYASDRSSACHEKAAKFLQTVTSGDESCYLAWITVMGYLRMATHPSLFAAPLSPAEAQGNIERLFDCPHVRGLSEADGFWRVYREVAGETPVRGNLVPDAHLAAILKQHGIRTLVTHDRDFRKFPFLRVVDPLV